METGKSQYLQYIVKHKSIPKLGVKDDNRELANGFGQFLTCNMHMNRYLELMADLKQQTRALLDTFVQLTEEAILMVADRESAHFLRLYKTEFTNFLDEYARTVEPALEADFIAPLAECTRNVDRVLAKVEDDHTNALLEYRHYIAKLEKMGDEDDTQKLLRTHEKLLAAANRLTSATNNVYEEFNLFDDFRRKMIFDQTPRMFAAQRQLFHELLETMDRMDLTAHPLPAPNHYKPFHIDVPPCPVPVVGRETLGGGGGGAHKLAIDVRPSIAVAGTTASSSSSSSSAARHMRTQSSPGMGVMPLSPIARNRPERSPWDSPEDDQKQATTNHKATKFSTVKKAFALRRPQTASDTESKGRSTQGTASAAPSSAAPPPPVPPQRPAPPPGAGSGTVGAPTTPPRTRPPNPQAVTPIRTPLVTAPPPPRPSKPPPKPLQMPKPPVRAPTPPQGPPPAPGRPPRPAPPPPGKQAPPPPPAKHAPHPPAAPASAASDERGPPPPLPPRRRSYSEAAPTSHQHHHHQQQQQQQPASSSVTASAFARMPPPPPPVRRNSRANDLAQRDALTAEVIDAVRAVQQNARRPSFDHS